jgi:phosphatidylinositol alpha-1,6-mannosyltransferase
MSRRRRGRIVALLPGLGGPGGIQRHNRMFCQVLTEWAAEREIEVSIVTLRDRAGWHDARYVPRPVIGCGGDRNRFAARAARELARPHDLLIVGIVDFGILLTLRRLLGRRAPVLTIVHGIEVWKPLPWTQRLALTDARCVLSVSRYTADRVHELHAPEVAVEVVPIPLDPEFAAEAKAFADNGAAAEPSSVLAVARMNVIDREKGIETLIRAFAELDGAAGHGRCVIVGDGDDRPRLEAVADELGAGDAVRFAGPVPDPELHAYLAGTGVFVLPSAKEGFGIVFLEAMCHGKPVIAGAHGGSPEVVTDGHTGLLVPHGDVRALRDALGTLLRDPQRRAAMGAAGAREVRQRFSYERFRLAIGELLGRLLDGAL